MLVTVEEVRPVLVGMHHPLVLVGMRVAEGGGQADVGMVVVTIVVAVDMLVAQGLVYVDVNVALHQQQRYRAHE